MNRDKRSGDIVLYKLVEDLAHKNWSIRKRGYETVLTLDQKIFNWNDVARSLVKSVVAEKNVPALEKGLAAILCLLDNVEVLDDESTGQILDGVVRRCLSNWKTGVRETIAQICSALVDKRKADFVTAALLKNISSTNRKQALASVKIFTALLRRFGPRVINASKFLPKIVDLCNDKSTFQQEVKDCLKQLYTDLGPVMKDYLSPSSPSVKKAIDAELAKIDDNPETSSSIKWLKKLTFLPSNDEIPRNSFGSTTGRPFSSKILNEWKSPQTAKRRIRSARAANDKDDNVKTTQKTQHGATLEDMMKVIQSDQWTERKNGLELLGTHLKTAPTLSPVDTSKLIKILRNIILEDTNVLIVAKAVQCIAGMSNGKNEAFRQEAPLLMTLLLERFKEKKSVVINALREATDAIVATADTQNIVRYIALSLEHKNPSIKLETEALVQRCYLMPNRQLLKTSNWRPLVVNLIKNLAYQDQAVREKAMAALGTIAKAVGDEAVAPFFENVLKHQLIVIEKYSRKAEVHLEEQVEESHCDKNSDDGNCSSEESLLPQRGSDNSVVSKLEKIAFSETEAPSSKLGQKLSESGQKSSVLGEKSSELKTSFFVDESSVLLPVTTTAVEIPTIPTTVGDIGSKMAERTIRRQRPLSSSDRDKLSSLRYKIQTLREMWLEMQRPLANTM